MKNHFEELFDQLALQRGDVFFVHASMDRLGDSSVSGAQKLVEALLERLGPRGTLLMPSYPWRNDVAPFKSGVAFDVRRSPSRAGLLSEVFRRMPGTLRSEQLWVPVIGQGALAAELLRNQLEIEDPFSPDATFAQLARLGARVVGLGVSLNTSSLAHLPDFELNQRMSLGVFSETPVEGVVVRADGRQAAARSLIVKPEVSSAYRPSRVIEQSALLQKSLRRADAGRAIRFSYPIAVYVSEAVRLGTAALDSGGVPPWLEAVFVHA